MKEIKFCGVRVDNREVVYGDLTHHSGMIFINDCRVHNDSISQFCGYESNGDEVYENDIVIAHGKEYTVQLSPLYGVFKNLKSCTLKG